MEIPPHFSALVNDAYEKEEEILKKKGAHAEIALVNGLSVKGLDLKGGKTSFRPSVSKLEVFASWKLFSRVIQQRHVFEEYMPLVRKAFGGVEKTDPADYRSMRTLLHLLANTIENAHRDNSTECRYVTLLEVMLSYQEGWEPSEEVSRLWVRLMQRIPADVPPLNFRRKAYRVLVSLSWVPSSKGLLAACSFEDNQQVLESEKAPKEVKDHFKRIRSSCLPRYDCVNQLLDRLKDETDVCVAIRSENEGFGKTTLAALVASHSSILRVFRVLWVPIERQKITYSVYARLLSEICEQLGIEPSWPEYVARFEEPAFRQLRESQYMEEAREKMAKILSDLAENVLLVLDDVQDAKQIESFRFNENQSMIVTTLDPNLKGVDWTIELDPLSEEEAIELFLTEADLPSSHILGCTNEIKSIVKSCEYHPLTVRTAARWFLLKQTTAGLGKGMEEIVNDFDSISKLIETEYRAYADVEAARDPDRFLFDMLSQILAPTRQDGKGKTTILFLCFAAMLIVFPDPVPLDAVLLLWAQLLEVEEEAASELKHGNAHGAIQVRMHAWYVAEGLVHMGVIAVTEKNNVPWVEAHHKVYTKFAVHITKKMKLGSSDKFEVTVGQWNRAFVTSYYENRIMDGEPETDDSLSYATRKLPSHLFTARMFAMGETILSDEGFFQARVAALGWDDAVEMHVSDCVRLQKAAKVGDKSSKMSPIFSRFAVLVGGGAMNDGAGINDGVVIDVASALYQIGFALTEAGFHRHALAQFEKAQELLPQSQPLRASIMYGASWALLANGENAMAVKSIKACRKVMEDCPRTHVLYGEAIQVMGDIYAADCEYKEALQCYDELQGRLQKGLPKTKIELGSLFYKKGKLYQVMADLDMAKQFLSESLKYKEEISENSENLAEVHSRLGDVLLELRQISEARQHFEKVISIYGSLKVPSSATRFQVVTGKLRFLYNDDKGCFDKLLEAHDGIRKHNVGLMDASAYDLRCIARIFQARGDLDVAVAVLHDSLALTDDRPLSLERSCSLLDLGNCLLDQNQPSDGLECFEKSLEIRIVKLGECLQVLESLKTMGSVHLSLGDNDEALKVFRKVHEVALRIAPDKIEFIAGALFAIGEAYDAQGHFDLAMENVMDCKKVLEKGRAKDHPDVAKALQRLGDLLASQLDLDEAEEYFKEALRIRRMNFDEALLAETQQSMGLLYRKSGRMEEAENMFVEALEIRSKLNLDRETGETLLEVGNIYRIKGELEDALSLFEKGREVLEEHSDLLGSVYMSSGHTMLALGKDGEALTCYSKARELRREEHGDDSPKYGNSSRSMGIANYLLGNEDEALVCLNDFVRIAEANLEDSDDEEDDEEEEEEEDSEDLDYVLSIVLLGDINFAKGKTEQAENVWTIAKEICEDNADIFEELPGLETMLTKRSRSMRSSRKGFLSRLRLSDDRGTKNLELDAEEVAIIRSIIFMDD